MLRLRPPVSHPATGQYIVGYSSSLPASARSAMTAHVSARVLPSRLGAIRAEVVSTDAAGALALSRQPGVRYVEPNTAYHVDSLPSSPNDQLFSQLWALSNTGQRINLISGTAGDDIGAKRAWAHGTGSSSVVVADIDTGLDVTHPDLAPNLWVNPGENCAGCRTDGIDNDGNGFVDDWHGWDFTSSHTVTGDANGHGTHTAGTIGARGDNGIGVIGVSPTVSLMPVRFIDSAGTGTDANAAAAIVYAVQNGARVINGSWSGDYSQAVTDAIALANAHGVLYVASAENNGNANATYPSATDLPNVIAVAASDQNDKLASWSSFGDSVDLAAPGVNIESTWPGASYAFLDGTSMAAPQVSGAAALLISQHPTATVATIKALLLDSVTPVASMSGKVLSGGRLNVGAAADCSGSPQVWIDSPRLGFVAAAGRPVTVRVQAGECTSPSGVTVTAMVGTKPVTLTSTGDGFYTGTFTPFATGGTTLTASASDGTHTATRSWAGKVVPDLSLHGVTRTITTTAGADALASFTEQAGHSVTLQLGPATFGAMTVTISGPDGAKLLLPASLTASGGQVKPPTATWLPGEYTVRVHPVGKGAGSVPISVLDPNAPPDSGATIATDGTPTVASLPTAGAVAAYTFPGTAGGRISLRITADTIAGTTVQILKPDGKSLASLANVTTAGVYVNDKALPLTGTYTLIIDPNGNATGALTAQLWNVPPDVSGSLVVNDPGQVVSLASPGQNASLTFAGTAGTAVTLRLTADSIPGAAFRILMPDSSVLAGPKSFGLAGGKLATTLPVTGTYTVVIDPATYHAGALTVQLTSP